MRWTAEGKNMTYKCKRKKKSDPKINTHRTFPIKYKI
jgi:hypothetical protein